MQKHQDLTEQRIQAALHAIENLIYPERAPLDLAVWHVDGEPVPLETALAGSYEPIETGYEWGTPFCTTWFRLRGEVPAAWDGCEVVALMHFAPQGSEGFAAEGLIYRDKKIMRALNVNRQEIEIGMRGGEKFEFFIEAAVNNHRQRQPGKPMYTVGQAELAWINRAVFDYFWDYKVCADLMAVLPYYSQRRAELRHALNESLNCLDFDDSSTLGDARAALAGVLAKKNGDTVHQMSAIGHAHMDSAWLWPLRETIRKCARTFSTAVDYMERYPEYVFGCSQAVQYAWMKAHYPEIYAKMRRAAQRGQWEPIGSMWVEVDCNLAGGESLIRQILYGKRFWEAEFGCETRDVWIPDVFGYSAALPQIFAGCGIDFFVTQKMSWSQFNKFPHHTFLWEGLDGTRTFTHFLPANTYNGSMLPKQLIYNVESFKEHGRASRSLYAYGFGDGGGGPTIGMLEMARRVKDLDGVPKVTLERLTDFIQKAQADATDLPVWVGELYLEYHRGTYTTQAKTKLGNRRSEFLLRDAEFFDAVSRVLAPDRTEKAADPERAVYDVTGLGAPDAHRHVRALERAWKLVLMNQFHDIIPGSSITWVYKDNAQDYETVGVLANSVIDSAKTALQVDTTGFKAPVRIDNTLGFERREVVEFAPGKLAQVTVPSAGYTVVERDAACERSVTVAETNGEIVIENSLIRLKVGADGLLKSLWDKEASREALSGDGNLFQLHNDRPINYDAWDVDIFYKETVSDLREVESVRVVEDHPLRAQVQIARRFGKSRIVQNVIVRADSKHVDFVTDVDWQENHKLLKVAFPVEIRSSRATYEIQFGHLDRPTHANTSWDMAQFEVCAHKWADLSEPGYGVALLNDCKYGHDIQGNVMRLSLLRAPTDPDPIADRGQHRFTYALLPHAGSLQEGRVIEEAYALNVPLRMEPLPAQPGALPPTQSFFQVDRPGVIIESIKVAEAGDGIIVRLYEAHGARGLVKLHTTLPVKSAQRTDLLENPVSTLPMENGVVEIALRPFEIATVKY